MKLTKIFSRPSDDVDPGSGLSGNSGVVELRSADDSQRHSQAPRGTFGGVYSPSFLDAVRPLYNLHMGCENMGPLLYSLVRFAKVSFEFVRSIHDP